MSVLNLKQRVTVVYTLRSISLTNLNYVQNELRLYIHTSYKTNFILNESCSKIHDGLYLEIVTMTKTC